MALKLPVYVLDNWELRDHTRNVHGVVGVSFRGILTPNPGTISPHWGTDEAYVSPSFSAINDAGFLKSFSNDTIILPWGSDNLSEKYIDYIIKHRFNHCAIREDDNGTKVHNYYLTYYVEDPSKFVTFDHGMWKLNHIDKIIKLGKPSSEFVARMKQYHINLDIASNSEFMTLFRGNMYTKFVPHPTYLVHSTPEYVPMPTPYYSGVMALLKLEAEGLAMSREERECLENIRRLEKNSGWHHDWQYSTGKLYYRNELVHTDKKK